MLRRFLILSVAILSLPALVGHAADHLDAPNLAGFGQRDINDLYAFQSPTNPMNSVLIMTVNPLAGVLSPTTFGSDVSYQFQINNSGGPAADLTFQATFGAAMGGSQSFSFGRVDGPIATGMTGSAFSAGGGNVLAGIFDDPFFFDLAGFQDGLNFTGTDFFAGQDVSAIVFEVPSSELGGPNIGVQARTLVDGEQVDRMGRPAINTVLVPEGRKQEFNEGSPENDFATFGDDVNATITALSNMANADALTGVLLPDLLTYNTSDASGFLNGRGLADDVIDAELTLLTASMTPVGDGVDANDRDFRSIFPYLATANNIATVPEPTSLAIWLTAAVGCAGFRRRRR